MQQPRQDTPGGAAFCNRWQLLEPVQRLGRPSAALKIILIAHKEGEAGPSLTTPLTCKQGPETPDLFHKARHSLPRHCDEGRVLVPAFVARIDVSRMLNQSRGNHVSVIKVRPPLGSTSVGSRTHRHKIHGGVIVQGPNEPRRRSGRRAQLLDLLEFIFTHVAPSTSLFTRPGVPRKPASTGHPGQYYQLISLTRISESFDIFIESLVVCDDRQSILYRRMQDRSVVVGNHRIEGLALPHAPEATLE